jgi:transposase
VLAEAVGSNKDTVRRILEEKLELRKRHALWVPHALTEAQKIQRVDLSRNLRDTLQSQKFSDFADIITGDESWFLYDYPYTSFWMDADAPRVEIPKVTISTKKTMLVVWWGVDCTPVLKLVERGKGVTATYFIETVLLPLSECQKKRTIAGKKLFIHMDNAPAHRAKATQQYFKEKKLFVIPHPPYSPDLAPSDFFLFGYLKERMKGRKSSTPEELLENIKKEIEAIPRATKIRVFDDWIHRLETVIASGGEYY